MADVSDKLRSLGYVTSATDPTPRIDQCPDLIDYITPDRTSAILRLCGYSADAGCDLSDPCMKESSSLVQSTREEDICACKEDQTKLNPSSAHRRHNNVEIERILRSSQPHQQQPNQDACTQLSTVPWVYDSFRSHALFNFQKPCTDEHIGEALGTDRSNAKTYSFARVRDMQQLFGKPHGAMNSNKILANTAAQELQASPQQIVITQNTPARAARRRKRRKKSGMVVPGTDDHEDNDDRVERHTRVANLIRDSNGPNWHYQFGFPGSWARVAPNEAQVAQAPTWFGNTSTQLVSSHHRSKDSGEGSQTTTRSLTSIVRRVRSRNVVVPELTQKFTPSHCFY
jgi:hypothetical protein